jgi:hypothetical protein
MTNNRLKLINIENNLIKMIIIKRIIIQHHINSVKEIIHDIIYSKKDNKMLKIVEQKHQDKYMIKDKIITHQI